MLTNLSSVLSILAAVVTIIAALLTTKAVRDKILSFFLELRTYITKDRHLATYFNSTIPDDLHIDILFYQLGLRSRLAVIDCLYFEYLNFLLTKYSIKKIVIIPTIDKSRDAQNEEDFISFKINVSKILKTSNIEFLDPHIDKFFELKDLVSNDFLNALTYIGSEEYFSFLRKEFSLEVNTLNDFNKFRPNDQKVRDLFTHIYRSWAVVKYLYNSYGEHTDLKISFIFWEWEVDKIGMLKYFSNNSDNMTVFPILGKTQMLTEKIPVPVFVEENSISFFEDLNKIIVTAIRFKSYISKYNILLRSIISNYEPIIRKNVIENGKKYWLTYRTSFNFKSDEKFIPDISFFEFLGLIIRIQKLLSISV
jgi:hypothetical protein